MGVFLGVVGAIVSIPMTFHKPTAVWFNANYAKHDLPDGGLEGIETIFEVGGCVPSSPRPHLSEA